MPQLNTTISKPTHKRLERLTELGYTKRVAVELAIDHLYRLEFSQEDKTMSEQAHDRVNSTPELDAHSDTIFYDWPEGDDHLEWVATAPVDEIVDWAETVESQSD